MLIQIFLNYLIFNFLHLFTLAEKVVRLKRLINTSSLTVENPLNYKLLEELANSTILLQQPYQKKIFFDQQKDNNNYTLLKSRVNQRLYNPRYPKINYALDQKTKLINPCLLPKQVGLGVYRIPRWYYNFHNLRCEPFYWSGCCANTNNFLSLEDCEKQCKDNRFLIIQPSIPMTDTVQSGQNLKNFNEYYQLYPEVSQEQNKFFQQSLSIVPVEPSQNSLIKSIISMPKSVMSLNQIYTPEQLSSSQQSFLIKKFHPCVNSASNNLIECFTTKNVCNDQQFCHVGPNSRTTVCCNKFTNIDPCNQPLIIGVGNAKLKRFYYNPITQKCESFFYNGYQGNENNFLTLNSCENLCYVNPCAKGEPYQNENGIVYCSSLNNCPAEFYCHIGNNIKTTVCCPTLETHPCQQDLDVGKGFDQILRWYFDQSQQTCLSFLYTGLKGTQNNFLSKNDCENSCYSKIDPCRLPIEKPLRKCKPELNSCNYEENLWCHIGTTEETTVCCPVESINRCYQPLEEGIGNMLSKRWFFDSNSKQCNPFIYHGLKGNQNNFISREECLQHCFPNPCLTEIETDKIQFCSAENVFNTCPKDYWCHVGSDSISTICCPNAKKNFCNLPVSFGVGSSNLKRFYYDKTTKTCQQFTYYGMKGNQNNFLSLEACQLSCKSIQNPCIGQPAKSFNNQILFCTAENRDTCPVNFWCHLGENFKSSVCCPGATNPCSVPLAPGTGNSNLLRWYYDIDKQKCEAFQYNGRRGNQNNFITQAECEKTCPEQLCLLSIDRGICNDKLIRFAFDRKTEQCIPFEYSGCGGNLNNFLTKSDCFETCGKVNM